MPRTPIDYSKTVIYKIVCNDLSVIDCYVGSTTDFTKRKCKHKSDCKTSHLRVYEFIFTNGGWDNWTMLEIEKYPCNDNNEARLRERYWYEQLNANLNMINPNRGPKECCKKYRDENKDKIIIIQKLYNENNKIKIALRQKEYYNTHIEEILQNKKEYRENNIDDINDKQRIYYADNKDLYKKSNHISYLNNKDKISEHRKMRVQCKCGKTHNHSETTPHSKSKFHQNFLLTQTIL